MILLKMPEIIFKAFHLGKINNDLIETYIEQGPRMVDYLHENSRVKYRNLPHYPDYFPDNPGGKEGNRSMEPEPIKGTELGDDFKYLRGNTHKQHSPWVQ